MKTFDSLEHCMDRAALTSDKEKEAFSKGWFAAAQQINNMLDSDLVQHQLEESQFLTED